MTVPTLRRRRDSVVTLSIAGRTVIVTVRLRPIAPVPIFAGYTVQRDEAGEATVLDGAAAEVSGGWWIELLDGTGAPVIGAMRLTLTSDLWRAHNAYLRTLYGAHLILSCTATPSGLRPLAGQCEITLAPAALA